MLIKNFTDLCEKYPVGFRDCIAIAQNRYFMMIPRSNINNSNYKKMAEFAVQIKYSLWLYVVRCAIWYHLYNLKNLKNTHGGMLSLSFLNCINGTKS